MIVKHVASELNQSMGRKRGPDVALHRTFRRMVSLAEDEKRSGVLGWHRLCVVVVVVVVVMVVVMGKTGPRVGGARTALLAAAATAGWHGQPPAAKRRARPAAHPPQAAAGRWRDGQTLMQR